MPKTDQPTAPAVGRCRQSPGPHASGPTPCGAAAERLPCSKQAANDLDWTAGYEAGRAWGEDGGHGRCPDSDNQNHHPGVVKEGSGLELQLRCSLGQLDEGNLGQLDHAPPPVPVSVRSPSSRSFSLLTVAALGGSEQSARSDRAHL